MDLSALNDAPDAAADLVAVPMRLVSDLDLSLPDALDIDIADVAESAVEFAGDVAGVVAKTGGRGARRVLRFSRRNPKQALGVLAVLLVVVGVVAAKRRSGQTTADSTNNA